MKKVFRMLSAVLVVCFVFVACTATIFAAQETVNLNAALKDKADWYLGDQHGGTLEVANGELVCKGGPIAVGYKGDKFENKLISFKIKNAGSAWNAIMLRNNPNQEYLDMSADQLFPWIGKGAPYVIFIKPTGELQVTYYAPGAAEPTNIIEATEATVLADGQYHEMQVGAIDTNGGTKLIIKIDGKEIVNQMVPEAAAKKPHGYFAIASISADDVLTLGTVEETAVTEKAAVESTTTKEKSTSNPKTGDASAIQFVLLGVGSAAIALKMRRK